MSHCHNATFDGSLGIRVKLIQSDEVLNCQTHLLGRGTREENLGREKWLNLQGQVGAARGVRSQPQRSEKGPRSLSFKS